MALKMTEEWDKVFPKSEKVNHRKVSFKNHFGIELAADLYDNFEKIPFDTIEEFIKENIGK